MSARSVLMIHPQRLGPRPEARARALTNHGSAVVIRIPDRMAAPYAAMIPKSGPRLYVHEGARQALERRFAAAGAASVRLAITDNRHSMISHSWEGGVLRARVHHMFLDAPPDIQTALVRYVTESDADASMALGSFIDSRSDRLVRRGRRHKLSQQGKHHDLHSIFVDVNDRYFGGSVTCLLTWGRHTKTPKPRTTIKLGSYDDNERLIRIHPALDRPWVPRYFVAFIIFHEMLHHVFPSRRSGARRELHSADFRERERTFRHYERALLWEAKNLRRMLRA